MSLNNLDVVPKLSISFFWALGPTLALYNEKFNSNESAALMGAYIVFIYCLEWFYHFSKTDLCLRKVLCTKMFSWSIPHQLIEYKNKLVYTISSLSSCRGSTQHRIVTQISVCSGYCILYTLLTHVKSQNIKIELHHTFAAVAAIGMCLIGLWEYNDSCQIHTHIHHICLGLLSCILLAFLLQQEYSQFSVLLCVVTACLLLIVVFFWNAATTNLIGVYPVHKISQISIILEALLLLPIFVCTFSYIYLL